MSGIELGISLRTRMREALESNSYIVESIQHALTHVGKKNRLKILNGQPEGIGTFFELLVYEIALQYSGFDKDIRFVVAKGIDASKRNVEPSNISFKDGLYYDRDLRVTIKGDGRSLGEYDFVLFDKLGDILFFEVKLRQRSFNGIKYKLQYKMRILEELFGSHVNLLLVCTEDMDNSGSVRDVLETTDGEYASLRMPNQEYLSDQNGPEDYTIDIKRDEDILSKLCYWDQLETLRKLFP